MGHSKWPQHDQGNQGSYIHNAISLCGTLGMHTHAVEQNQYTIVAPWCGTIGTHTHAVEQKNPYIIFSDLLVFTRLAIAPIHYERLCKSQMALFKWPASYRKK